MPDNLPFLFAFRLQSADTYKRIKKIMTKKIVRALILALFLASALIVTISTRTEAYSLSLSTICATGNTLLGSKVYASARVKYRHPFFANHFVAAHNHPFSYSVYASVGYKVDQIPAGGGTAIRHVNSWTRFYGNKWIKAYITSGDHELSDAYASASASESNHDNWDFCPKP